MDRERQTDGEEDAGEHASPMSRCQSDRVTRSFSSWEMADRESEEHKKHLQQKSLNRRERKRRSRKKKCSIDAVMQKF